MASKNLNVLMITPDYPPDLYGGIGIHVNELINSLQKNGCHVTVIVARLKRRGNDVFSVEKINGVTVVKFPTESEGNFRKNYGFWPIQWANLNTTLFPEVLKFLNEEKQVFDLIHAHDYYHSFISVGLKEMLKIPLVTTIHALTPPVNHFDDSMRRYIIQASNSVISVSASLKERIIERYVHIKPEIIVIHNGVRLLPHKFSMIDVTAKKRDILFCGRLFFTKGAEVLIRAFSKMASLKKYKLKLVGEGPLKEKLHDLVNELEISDKVSFLGYKQPTEVRKIMQNSKIVVVPSIDEPFGLVALEAMSEGVPLISTTAGGLKEFVINGVNGIAVPPGDVDSLSLAMEELLNNEVLQRELVKNALLTVQKHGWDRVAHETVDVYNSIKDDRIDAIHLMS
jgi:glycosyltransferase involved in cell wall biosynthesis